MLDGDCSFKSIRDAGIDIYWGVYIGTDNEFLVAGKLQEVAHEIERRRAKTRSRKGRIMDTYLPVSV